MQKLLFFWILFSLMGCVKPAQHFDSVAKQYGFNRTTVATPQFEHILYRTNRNYPLLPEKKLHVYLDGDGTPWEQELWLAEDPTARNPLILRLLNIDTAPSILLGRPCYYGLNHTLACHPKYWTSHRYARIIVESMVAALKKYLETDPASEIVLIGYSGGGTLAMLMAPQLTNVRTIITLAANLDTVAWSRLHQYPVLVESLNPADLPHLPATIRQYHFAGSKDSNVPASIIQTVAAKQNAYFKIQEDLTHNGCWECIWRDLLNHLKV